MPDAPLRDGTSAVIRLNTNGASMATPAVSNALRTPFDAQVLRPRYKLFLMCSGTDILICWRSRRESTLPTPWFLTRSFAYGMRQLLKSHTNGGAAMLTRTQREIDEVL